MTIRPASDATFRDLEAWRYEPPYDFYDGDVEPVLNPERFYEAVDADGELVGFYYFEAKGDVVAGVRARGERVDRSVQTDARAELARPDRRRRQVDALEIGLGLRPELVGRGLGLEFFRAGVEFGRARFRPARVVLAVAAFNERAVKVYERAGFVEVGRHVRHFERWGDVEFVDMVEATVRDA